MTYPYRATLPQHGTLHCYLAVINCWGLLLGFTTTRKNMKRVILIGRSQVPHDSIYTRLQRRLDCEDRGHRGSQGQGVAAGGQVKLGQVTSLFCIWVVVVVKGLCKTH